MKEVCTISKHKRTKAFLLLWVMLLGLVISGCAPEQPTKPSDTANAAYPYTLSQLLSMWGYEISDIKSITIHRRPYDSVMTHYEETDAVKTLINSLDQGYALITKNEFNTLYDYANSGSLYLNFGGNEIRLYIMPDQTAVIEYDGSYYISEDVVTTHIIK